MFSEYMATLRLHVTGQLPSVVHQVFAPRCVEPSRFERHTKQDTSE